jgi:hypothetical protein
LAIIRSGSFATSASSSFVSRSNCVVMSSCVASVGHHPSTLLRAR